MQKHVVATTDSACILKVWDTDGEKLIILQCVTVLWYFFSSDKYCKGLHFEIQ